MLVLANVLQPLIDFFEAILKFLHDSAGLGWGMSIVALTVIVRAALLPLTIKQFKSMQSLVQHQPELKRIQERYKDDPERRNQEIMRFYRENKVNPAASCLPLLAQMPVFLGLFYMLQKDLKLDICGAALTRRGITGDEVTDASCSDVLASGGPQQFLFIPDLTTKATGAVLVALIVLYIGSQLLSSLLMSVNQDRNQRILMIALPFIFVLFVINFPAGLVVYWITTNLWTIVQQAIIRRMLGPMRPTEDAGKDGGTGDDSDRGKRSERRPAGAKIAEPATATAGAATRSKPNRAGPPPASPRKKKKRSGRRR